MTRTTQAHRGRFNGFRCSTFVSQPILELDLAEVLRLPREVLGQEEEGQPNGLSWPEE